MEGIKSCQMNYGDSVDDQANVYLHLNQKISKEESARARIEYAKIEQITSRILIDQQADVYFLQEVGSCKRDIIESLQKTDKFFIEYYNGYVRNNEPIFDSA